MLSVVALYGLHPLDLHATASVPRLNAQLMTLLAAAKPEWEVLAVSPAARDLPGVETVGVALPRSAERTLRLGANRVGDRLLRRRPGGRSGYEKGRWGEAAAAWLADARPDSSSTVVICTHLEVAVAARRAMPRSRIVHWMHTPISAPLLEASLVADAAVAPTVAVYRDAWRRLGNWYPPPLWVIPNWVDTEAFEPPAQARRASARTALGLAPDDIALVFVDRDWIKGGQVLERALASLPPGAGAARIVLLSVGRPERDRRVLAPGREVWRLGVLPPDQLRDVHAAGDLGVVPSVCEDNQPLAALEMMASGLPLLASDVGGLAEIVDEGVTGRLVPLPNHVPSWNGALTALVDDAEGRRRLGSAARASALERFSQARACEEWVRVVEALAGN